MYIYINCIQQFLDYHDILCIYTSIIVYYDILCIATSISTSFLLQDSSPNINFSPHLSILTHLRTSIKESQTSGSNDQLGTLFCYVNIYIYIYIYIPSRKLTYPTKREVWKIIDSNMPFLMGYVSFLEGIYIRDEILTSSI